MRASPGVSPAAFAGLALAEAQRRVTTLFTTAGLDTPGLDGRLLLAGACRLAASAVVLEPKRIVTPAEAERLAGFVRRRLAREPVSRILGHRHFHRIRLEITPATLDPRPETESLVDGVLELVSRSEITGGSAPHIADAGTGSGAILLALLAALPGATGIGTDRSSAAIEVARRNAERLGLGSRARFEHGNWLEPVEFERFDLIVSNPPYIPSATIATLDPEVRDFDPHLALDGGDDGLEPYRYLVPESRYILTAGGWLVLEVGQGQSGAVHELARDCGAAETRVWLDLAGKPRCVAIRHY